jgi:hypothetical protein
MVQEKAKLLPCRGLKRWQQQQIEITELTGNYKGRNFRGEFTDGDLETPNLEGG